MHDPCTARELKEYLEDIEDDKEVVIYIANNYYDIVELEDDKESLVLNIKLCSKRDIEDSDKANGEN